MSYLRELFEINMDLPSLNIGAPSFCAAWVFPYMDIIDVASICYLNDAYLFGITFFPALQVYVM